MMNRPKNQTALLFFSRSALAESRCKSFVKHSCSKNREISQLLINQSLIAVRRSKLPYYIVDESKQVGSSFGERLSNAFQTIFADGYDSVIAVGNDTPALTSVNWNHVESTLRQGRAVLGPTVDGGSYLIGLTKSQFNPETFEDLHWKSANLFDDLLEYAAANGTKPAVLEPHRDINSSKDVAFYLSVQVRGFLKVFQAHLKNLLSQHLSSNCLEHHDSNLLILTNYSRPPPLFA